jgi:rhamnosyl/mannosyltransferase
LGRVSDDQLVGAYHAATALWFPSNVRSEGFGLVQVEAMASGCPVINANIMCSGVPWVSRHELEALSVPVNNPVAFAGAAQRLLDEPGLRDRLVAAGRKRAAYFNNQAMAERSLEIYARVLSKVDKIFAY